MSIEIRKLSYDGMGCNLIIQKVLDCIWELGYIKKNKNTNEILFIPPRMFFAPIDVFLNYIKDVVIQHSVDGFECFFTLFDGWRETIEPCFEPLYVPLTDEIFDGCNTHIHHRFVHHNQFHHLFPVLPLPVITYNSHLSDHTAINIPDTHYLQYQGFLAYRESVDILDCGWEDKIPSLIWRGSVGHYPTYKLYGSKCNRVRLLEYSASNPELINASSGETDPLNHEQMLKYKYQIDLDGHASAWTAFYWKCYSKSVVFKVQSHWRQWFYKDLKPWIHYIPILPDLSDLHAKLEWAKLNDDICKKIAENGRELMATLNWEDNLQNYNPFYDIEEKQNICSSYYK